VIRAAGQLGVGLDVVGDGPALGALQRMARSGVTFHGAAEESTVTALLEGCRAVCVGGEEEFGIVAVEAQAAGKPVVAYGAGGALETIEENVTGVLFREQTERSVREAIVASDALDTPPAAIARHAQRFGRAAFRRNLLAAIAAGPGARR
jgi:glycosyltransferase involved in cell wall biosynthesis